MQFILSPRAHSKALTAEVNGETLILNGRALDLSGVKEGDELPAEAVESAWLAGPVRREGGVLQVSLVLPHGADAPRETRFPDMLEHSEGVVPLPPYGVKPAPEREDDSGDIAIDWARRRAREERERPDPEAKAATARRYLAETDWYVIRQVELGTPIPGHIASERQAARRDADHR